MIDDDHNHDDNYIEVLIHIYVFMHYVIYLHTDLSIFFD